MPAKESKGKKKVAPDGGYGWLVVLGVSICNLSTRSIEPSFGLLFYDVMAKLDVQTTVAAAVMSTKEATINFSGMFMGPLMRTYSFRKVALFGSLLSAVGCMLTAPATNMTHILVTYSIMSGLGVGLVWSAALVAINTYFSKFRGQATGLAMAGTAVGFMLMPQVIQLMLEAYGFPWSMLILGAFGLHGLAGAALLQPVKWHLKTVEEESKASRGPLEGGDPAEAESLVPDKPKIAISDVADSRCQVEIGPSSPAENSEPTSPVPRIVSPTSSATTSTAAAAAAAAAAKKRKESIISVISNMDLTGSSFHLNAETETVDEDEEESDSCNGHETRNRQIELQIAVSDANQTEANLLNKTEKRGDNARLTYWQRIVKFMDLDLLKDPIYLNIIFGISLFFVAETNFKMVIPFFMADLGYTKSETAFCLSMMAVSDIVSRVVLPPIFDRVNITRRKIFLVFSILLAFSRSILAEQTSYVPFISTMVISGLFRGATLINCTLSISEHCSLEKLPAAFGLYMVSKGLVLVALGPLIGVIRDVSSSYPLCIHSQTILIILCSLAWGVEFCIKRDTT